MTKRAAAALVAALILLLTSTPTRQAVTAGPWTASSFTARPVLLARDRTEPSLAVDPLDLSFLVVGTNTNYDAAVGDTYPVAYYSSLDAGRRFVSGNAPVIRPFTTEADPTVGIAGSGTVFYSYLAESPAYCSNGRGAIILAASYDHGRSFGTAHAVDANSNDDKPSMAVESVPHGSAHVFVTWTRWLNSGSQLWYARSVDGGKSFGRAVMLHQSTGDDFGTVPFVGRGGHVYVFWSAYPETELSSVAPTHILMRESSDDGRTFFGPRDISGRFGSVPHMAKPAYLRSLTMPSVTMDASGILFAAWSAVTKRYPDGHVDADIKIARSTNSGSSWSKPRRVNDVRTADRFMPTISALSDGSIGVAFYDRRDGPWDLGVYAARVMFSHRFERGPNVRINGRSSPIGDIFYYKPGSNCFTPGRFFGDYIGSGPGAGGTFCVAWADTHRGVKAVTDIWFTRADLPGLAATSASGRR